jgi:hypothetical protein
LLPASKHPRRDRARYRHFGERNARAGTPQREAASDLVATDRNFRSNTDAPVIAAALLKTAPTGGVGVDRETAGKDIHGSTIA